MEVLEAVDRCAEVTQVELHPLPLFTLTMQVEGKFPEVAPGQFLMVQAPTTLEPYLRRAFSVFRMQHDAASTEIVIHGKVIGSGTAALARCRAGDEVRLLGPLGKGFELPRASAATRAVLVAGGVGSAALPMLAEELLAAGQSFDFIYGGRSERDLAHGELFAELARSSGGRYIAVTEDGSFGETGRVTGPLRRLLEHRSKARGSAGQLVYTCGPDPMMAAIAVLGRELDVPVQAALETPMGCGYGACLGCVVKQTDGSMALCCRNGPVFDAQAVAW